MGGVMRRHGFLRRGALLAVAGLVVVTGAVACGDAQAGTGKDGRVTLRLGYFPNLTHATPIVGLEKGIFTRELGGTVTLEKKTFNAGPAAVEALFSGAIDAVYMGPSPTINAFAKSGGKGVAVVAGAASGGAALVVKASITSVAQLKGKKLATPQLGNTQDVALRYWLKQHNLSSDRTGGGDVAILPQENAVAVDAFASGAIDGAWVPEPYVSRLVKLGGKVLVDERDLWPDHRFIVTNLVVSTAFLARHRAVVTRLVSANVATNAFINAEPQQAQQALSSGIGALTGKPLDQAQLTAAWLTLTFLDDPLASTLRDGATHAVAVGLLDRVELRGLWDLGPLNEVREQRGETLVTA